MVERMGSLFIVLLFTMYYFTTQCQAQESSNWMCPADHGYEICWQEATFAASPYLPCQCHLISNLTAACSWTSQNGCKYIKTLLLLIPFMHHDPPSSSTLFLFTHPPPILPQTPSHPPSSKLYSPLTSPCMHPYIHICIIALIGMHRHKYGPDAREHKHKWMHTNELWTFLTKNWKVEST